MPKLNWDTVPKNPIFSRNIVREARIERQLVGSVIEFEWEPGVMKYEWSSSGKRGFADTLERAEEMAEAVIAETALMALAAFGLNYKERIDKALAEALQHSQCDGAHHKAWSIDQIVRALTGCPMVTGEAKDCRGTPYTYEKQGESEEYLAFVRGAKGAFDEEEQNYEYEWNEGRAP